MARVTWKWAVGARSLGTMAPEQQGWMGHGKEVVQYGVLYGVLSRKRAPGL
jgi:hypothetical protein